MPGLKAARVALAAQIVTALAGVDPGGNVDVLPFDPHEIAAPMVTVSTAGVTPHHWRLNVRVYVDANQAAPDADLLDDLTEAIDLLLGDEAPRSTWNWEYEELKGIFQMTTTAEFPRDDF
jgi:hypothetical protein